MLAEKFTSLVNYFVQGMLTLPEAREFTPRQVLMIRVCMEETVRASARMAYRDCATVANGALDGSKSDRDEQHPTSTRYAALDGAVGAFAGMVYSYEQLEGVFCDGKEYEEQSMSTTMDSLMGSSDSSTPPPSPPRLKDPRKREV